MLPCQNRPSIFACNSCRSMTQDKVADAPAGNWVDRYAPGFLRPYLRLSRADRPMLAAFARSTSISKNSSSEKVSSLMGRRKYGFGEEALSMTARACNVRKRSAPTPAPAGADCRR